MPLIVRGRRPCRQRHQMRHQMLVWGVGPPELQSLGSQQVLKAVAGGVKVVAVLEGQCAVTSRSERSMHQISGGGGRWIARVGSRALSMLETVSVRGLSMQVVLAWENGYGGLSE